MRYGKAYIKELGAQSRRARKPRISFRTQKLGDGMRFQLIVPNAKGAKVYEMELPQLCGATEISYAYTLSYSYLLGRAAEAW